jgi:hypothetical protein
MRLVGQPSLFCPTEVYIDPVNVENSLLLKKVIGTHGACGSPMPVINPGLEPAMEQCLREYIAYAAAGGLSN